MPDERHTFETARIRLEEIAVEVRKRDTSLEKSLDLLEEGVRLANICTELVDHTDLSAAVTQEVAASASDDRTNEQVMEEESPTGGGAETAIAEPGPSSEDDESDSPDDDAPKGSGLPLDSEDVAFDEMDDDLHEPADADGDA